MFEVEMRLSAQRVSRIVGQFVAIASSPGFTEGDWLRMSRHPLVVRYAATLQLLDVNSFQSSLLTGPGGHAGHRVELVRHTPGHYLQPSHSRTRHQYNTTSSALAASGRLAVSGNRPAKLRNSPPCLRKQDGPHGGY